MTARRRLAAIAFLATLLGAAQPSPAATPRPDLMIARLGPLPVSATTGTSLSIRVQVGNTGNRRAPASRLALYLSSDRRVDRRDTRLTVTANVPAMRPRKRAQAGASVTVPRATAPGLYFLVACADGASRIRERSERNNCRASATMLRVTGPLPVPLPRPVPTMPAPVTPGVQDPSPDPFPGPTPSPAPTVPPTPEPTPEPLPSDPRDVATPLNPDGATSLHDSSRFLYTGPDPVQRGVSAGAISADRAAVLRGRVVDQAGNPVAGVRVEVDGHPELGHTLSRADGRFDLAFNGGGTATLNFRLSDYLPAQRQAAVPWQDWETIPDVVLTRLDAHASDVSLNGGGVAMGTPVADGDGARQNVALVEPGTSGQMVLPDGSTRALPAQVEIRVTEFTVGAAGDEAMPAELPPTSAYTYAVEYTVDDAEAAGAREVRFSKPLATYVENFLEFPTGATVPTGYYDRARAAWVPARSGTVIKVLVTSGGVAEVDTDGDGAPDPAAQLAALGIDETERRNLAALYAAGASLWRIEIDHFTPWDHNWGIVPPDGAGPPELPDFDEDDCLSEQSGSIIGCERQTLGERLALVGTPLTLNYRSDRVPDHVAGRELVLPVSGATLPPSVKRIEVEADVAGQHHTTALAAQPDQRYVFHWNGRDAYDRAVSGAAPATVRVGYTYDAVYGTTSRFASRGSGLPITGDRARRELTLWSEWRGTIGGWDARGAGLGGWTLDEQHRYDPVGRKLYNGDGSVRSVDGSVLDATVATVAGGGEDDSDGGAAVDAELDAPERVAVTADGTLLVADTGHERVRRVPATGTIGAFAGSGGRGRAGDGGPAAVAELASPAAIAEGSDGSVYIADEANNRIRRVGGDGRIATVAGGGQLVGATADGRPATDARLSGPSGVAVTPDGTLYIAERAGHRIRTVTPDGLIATIAGTGDPGFSGDGGRAAGARLRRPNAVAVGPEGDVFVADTLNHRVRRITPAGTIDTVAGGGTPAQGNGDGGSATSARLDAPEDVAAGIDGELIIADTGQRRVRRVTVGGTIVTVTGGGDDPGDGIPARQARLLDPSGVAAGPDGALYVVDRTAGLVRRIAPALPGFSAADIAIPSDDGAEVYQFDPNGRHARTIDAITRHVLLAFEYDRSGRLTSVRDGDGELTRIERTAAGEPESIVSHDGQRTRLTVDANGFLSSITNPAGERTSIKSTPGGLLAEFTDANSRTSTLTYDTEGRLVRDTGSDTHAQTLTRAPGVDGDVTHTTPEGRQTRYHTGRTADGGAQRSVTAPDGTTDTVTMHGDGTAFGASGDGSRTTLEAGADPRFGTAVPALSRVTTSTPQGVTANVQITHEATLSDPRDPLSVVALSDTTRLNGRDWSQTWTAGSRTWRLTTPEDRVSTMTLDENGRIASAAFDGLAGESFVYDTRGRLQTVTTGSGPSARATSFTYGPGGLLASSADAGGVTTVERDAAGRVVARRLPGGATVGFGYDATGNVDSVTPPGRPTHEFRRDARDRVTAYVPPDVGPGDETTTYTYDRDGLLTSVTRPGQTAVQFVYDAAGRIDRVDSDAGTQRYEYDAGTGHVSKVSAPAGIDVAYAFDGQLPTATTWSGPVAGRYAVSWNADVQPAEDVVGASGAVTYGYDGDLLLIRAGALNLTRDAAGLVDTGTLGAVTTDEDHSPFGDLQRSRAAHAAATLYDARYQHDALGRVTRKEETIEGATTVYEYEYDAANRLARVLVDGVEQARYGYDANGNRTSVTTAGGVATATYDAHDRLTTSGSVSYVHDLAGDLTEKRAGAEVSRYEHDDFGNLRRVELAGGTEVRYLVDGQHRRVGTMVDGQLAHGLLYADQLRPVAELAAGGAVRSRFVYGDRPTVPEFMVRAGRSYRFVTDELGSVRLVVDSADGTIAQRLDYDAFGRVLRDTNPGFQPFGFAGGLYDHRTGLVRFGARDYDAQTARFIRKDPARFATGSANLYAYADGDPVNYADRTGHGKIKVVVEILKGGKKVLHMKPGDIADALRRGKNILIEGRGAKKAAKKAAKEAWDEVVEHGPHGGPSKHPHFQPKNRRGRRGHANYNTNRVVIPGATLGKQVFGCNLLGDIADFFNPLSDVQDLLNLPQDLMGGDEGGGEGELPEFQWTGAE